MQFQHNNWIRPLSFVGNVLTNCNCIGIFSVTYLPFFYYFQSIFSTVCTIKLKVFWNTPISIGFSCHKTQTHILPNHNRQLPPAFFALLTDVMERRWVLEHNLWEQWGKIWASWRLVANRNEMLERVVTQGSVLYFTSHCHPTAGSCCKSNTLFFTR